MYKRKKKLIELFLLIIIISFVVQISSAEINNTNDTFQGNETVKNQNTVFLEPQTGNIDLFIESNRNFDRSLVILDKVINAIGVLVTLLTVIILLVGGFGFLEINRWRNTNNEIEKDAKIIKEIRQNAENQMETMRDIIDRANISVSDKPSESMLKILNEFNSKSELLEVLGATLEPTDYYNRGLALFNQGEYNLSLKALKKAIELDSEDFNTWILKGQVYKKLNRHGEAIKANKKAIKIYPKNPIAWSNLSGSLLDNDKIEDSLEPANLAIELDPNFYGGWYNRACYYSRKNQKPEALSDLKEAIRLQEEYKEFVKVDTDFEHYLDDPDFKRLVDQSEDPDRE